ncbi:unnamed protein product [Orchesella dallaii]|uniref:RRM domain-containing protein n=1 Tax=Orchesella dallaii TaxID=48710 RepID=A0ABP1QJA9_9HEXA
MDSDTSITDAIQIGDETQPRTLYVGNLDAQMTEEFLVVLFSQIGPVKGCKIIHEIFQFSIKNTFLETG